MYIMKDSRKKSKMHMQKWASWEEINFQVPKGSISASTIDEVTSAFDLWKNNLPYRYHALKMFMLLLNLVLQRTSQRNKTVDNKNSLDRRLAH